MRLPDWSCRDASRRWSSAVRRFSAVGGVSVAGVGPGAVFGAGAGSGAVSVAGVGPGAVSLGGVGRGSVSLGGVGRGAVSAAGATARARTSSLGGGGGGWSLSRRSDIARHTPHPATATTGTSAGIHHRRRRGLIVLSS